VLFHTGWTDYILPADPKAWVSGEPGMAEDVAVDLAKKGVLAVGSDTWGVDVIPPEKKDRPFQGHITLIKENGIYMLGVMNTGPLVKDKALGISIRPRSTQAARHRAGDYRSHCHLLISIRQYAAGIP